jgi:hypothetical protein
VSKRIRLEELVAEYMKLGREAFAEQYAGMAALRGIGKAKDVSEEEEFEGRTMMVSVGNPYADDEQTEVLETEPGSCTDVLWLIPHSSRAMSLGRNKSAEISIPEYSVSAEHGVLQWKAGKGLSIVNSAASNGIWIENNGINKIEPGETYFLEGEERVILGRFVFSFHYFEAWMMEVAHLAAIKRQAKKSSKKSSKKTGKKESGGFFKRLFGG